jgi:hypothetical protein
MRPQAPTPHGRLLFSHPTLLVQPDLRETKI